MRGDPQACQEVDSISEQDRAEQLLGGQRSVTLGEVPKYAGLQRKEPKNEHYIAPWVKIKAGWGRA